MNNKNFKTNLNVNPEVSRQAVYILTGIIILTIIAFSNSLKGEFLNWDDKKLILENSYVKDFTISGIKNIFIAIDKHDPLVAFTHALTYHFWGINPFPYHVLNLLFHILNVVLVFIFIFKLTKRNEPALIAAVLFAIHPLRVESVAWISERKDVLYSFFYLTSLTIYIKYIDKNFKIKHFVFSLLLFVCSLLSKFSAITLPVILILINYYYDRKFSLKVVIELIPFFILSFLRGAVYLYFNKTISENNIITVDFSFYERLFIGSYALIFYIVSFFYFSDLCVLHPFPVRTGNLFPMAYYIDFIFALIFVALIIWLLIKNSKQKKEIIFSVLFFLFNISLVLHFFPFKSRIVVGDRYSYLPYIGFFYLFGLIYCKLTDKSYKYAKKIKVYLLCFLLTYIFLCFVVTYNRNKIWTNSISLWSDAIKHFPEHYYGYYGLGNAKSDRGDFNGALEEYQKAINIKPDFQEAIFNMGIIFSNKGDLDKAFECFKKSNDIIKPDKYKSINNLGLAFSNRGNYDKAIECYQKAININPDFYEAFNNLGLAYSYKDDKDKAIESYQKAIEIKHDFNEAFNNMGLAYSYKGDKVKAIECYQKAINIMPDFIEVFYNMGLAYYSIGEKDKAIECFQKAINIKPDFQEAFNSMGTAYYYKGEKDKAIDCYQKAININPDFHDAYFNMGVAYSDKGDKTKSEECFKKANEINSNKR